MKDEGGCSIGFYFVGGVADEFMRVRTDESGGFRGDVEEYAVHCRTHFIVGGGVYGAADAGDETPGGNRYGLGLGSGAFDFREVFRREIGQGRIAVRPDAGCAV